MNLKIILYTTPGCFACNVMAKILQQVEEIENIPVIKKSIELDDNGIAKAKELGIKDFPTTIFIDADTEQTLHTLVGTYSIMYVTDLLKTIV